MPGHLGLALSGGGSRAAAFHRGTLRAVRELGLVDYVDRVSTVSGGSVFGAAWMAARAAQVADEVFLEELAKVLEKGFLWPALLNLRAVLLAVPGYSRTHRLAETFDALLLRGKRLSDLPDKPLLVLNSAALNHAQVVRFSPFGLSCIGVGASGREGSLPNYPLSNRISLGFATAASAAFPFGLPPLKLPRADIQGARFVEALRGQEALWLTDGGVLENLGIQTLMRSRQFAARHAILSDAGTTDRPWQPGGWLTRVKNAGIFGLSADTLARLLQVMNDKQNKSMRQLLVQELRPRPAAQSRIVLMVGVSQRWDELLTGVHSRKLRELGERAGVAGAPPERKPDAIRTFLERCGVDLTKSRSIYDEMGKEGGVEAANDVGTNFTGLSRSTLDLLAHHAAWQLHAVSAIYGPIPGPGRLA